MVTRFPLITATVMVASISIGTLVGIAPPASAQQRVITCESHDNRPNSCVVPTGGRVRLVRQISNSSCQNNWGYNRNRIWVRDGCRAQFVVTNGRFNRNHRYNRFNRNNRYNRYNRYNRNNRYDRYDWYNR
jgi:hypothetical protein